MFAIRLLGSYEGEKYVVEAQERVEMLVPESDPLVDPTQPRGEIGFWLELRDAAGKPLYRQIMRDPFSDHVEVFGDPKNDREPPMSMAPGGTPKGYLVLLVPDQPEGATVALVRSTYDAEKKELKIADVVQIPLAPDERQPQ